MSGKRPIFLTVPIPERHPLRSGMMSFKTLFPDEQAARAWFEAGRWPYGRVCPQCGSPRTHTVPHEKPTPYHCAGCRTYFSVRTGTRLHASNLPLRKWAWALHMVSARDGEAGPVGSVTMGRCLAVNRRTAGMAVAKIRQAVAEHIGQVAVKTERIDASVEDMRDALLGLAPEGGENSLPEDWEDLDSLLEESL